MSIQLTRRVFLGATASAVAASEQSQPGAGAASREPLGVALLLALSLFAIGPLLRPGYHWGAQDAR
ncbi:MAG TPA: hypothetical protein P5022_15920, partial [Candidatus Paceibacterota bacterium]|nr:hypothetical protein [Candidatus Paceibacterota bacterium]